jgi:hypothetical protein
MKLIKPSTLVVNWVSSCLSFLLSASTAATYILTAPNCTTTIINLEPCALNAALNFSISYWDLIKCLHFVDTTEREREDRGWKEPQRQDEDRVTLWITLLYEPFNDVPMAAPMHLFFFSLSSWSTNKIMIQIYCSLKVWIQLLRNFESKSLSPRSHYFKIEQVVLIANKNTNLRTGYHKWKRVHGISCMNPDLCQGLVESVLPKS